VHIASASVTQHEQWGMNFNFAVNDIAICLFMESWGHSGVLSSPQPYMKAVPILASSNFMLSLIF
jgi:hypothetical protein